VVIGNVDIGERCSIWPNVTVRGDINRITIGEETNIQDNSVLHVDAPDHPLIIGKRVTAGHSVVLHGCTIEDDALIGIGSIILNGARIGAGCIIAAGSLIVEGAEIPPGSMVMGVPGKVRREVSAGEREKFKANAQRYVDLRQRYREEPA
jgi:carbonic anhydrase/acetyltransferase-like protein (isoleucine patch superfamily)